MLQALTLQQQAAALAFDLKAAADGGGGFVRATPQTLWGQHAQGARRNMQPMLRRSAQRQPQAHPGAAARLAVDADLALHQLFDHGAHHAQAEPCALAAQAAAEERVKDARQAVAGNTAAGITHGKFDVLAVERAMAAFERRCEKISAESANA